MDGFDPKGYRFWFIRLTTCIGDALHIGSVGGAVVVAVVPYTLALALVVPLGEAGLFLRTPAVYLGCAGVAWVLIAATRALDILAHALLVLRQVALDPVQFDRYVETRLRNAARGRSSLPWMLGVGLVAATYAVTALRRWHETGVIPGDHAFRAFPMEWRAGTGGLVAAGLVILVFSVAIVPAFAVSCELLMRNLPFAWGLQKFRYMPLPGRVRLAIRPLINAYAWASGTWSAGIALFCVFFSGHWSVVNVALVAILAVVGIVTFAVPYASFRRLLDTSHGDMSVLLCNAVEQRSRRGELEIANVAAIAATNRAVAADPPPVLTRRGVLAYAVVQVAAFVAIVARDSLKDHLSSVTHTLVWPEDPARPATASKRPPRVPRR